MADYYVMFEGTQYDVADVAAGIAKAQELGPSAVLYAVGPVTATAHTAGVITVISGGIENAAQLFTGGNAVAVTTGNMTITGGTNYTYVFNGGRNATVENSTLTVEGGAIANLYTGGWMSSSTASTGDFGTVNFNGGTITSYLYAGAYCGVLGEAVVNVTDGLVTNYCAARGSGSVDKITLNVTGGTIAQLIAGVGASGTGAVIESNINISGGLIAKFYGGNNNGATTRELPNTLGTSNITLSGGTIASAVWLGNAGAQAGTTGNINFTMTGGVITGQLICGSAYTASAIGDVTVTLQGGEIRNNISGTADDVAGVQGKTVLNIDGYDGAAANRWFFGGNRGSAEEITINLKRGSMHLLCLGSATNGKLDCPITLNISGGSSNWVLGGGYNAGTAIEGDVTVNMTGGYVKSNFWMGNNTGKNAAGEVMVETLGDTYVNLSGGSVNTFICGAGKGITDGSTHVTVSGDFHYSNQIYAGGYTATGSVTGDTNLTVTGGVWSGTGAWLVGGGRGAVTEGKATLTVEGADTYHIFGGGAELGASVLGGVALSVTNSTVHGVIQGGGYRGNVEEGVTVSVTGGTTLRDMKANYWLSGWVVGGDSINDIEVQGGIATTVSGAIINGGIVGGSYHGLVSGGVELSVTNSVIGIEVTPTEEDPSTFDGGDIIVLGGYNTDISGETFTATISGVTAFGGLYQGLGGNYFEGDTVITVSNSTFGDGIYLEYGEWDEEVDPDTGETTITEYYTTDINGNVAISLSDVTVIGDVWGKGRYFDLAAFVEGKGITLSIAGAFSATGEVGYFDNITLAAGATIAAGVTTASAITAEAAAADGLYTLATGFAAQDSVIAVTSAGVTLGSVTLSEAITSGSFTAGADTYNIGISDDVLYLGKNTAIPEPTPPTPPTPTATGAEVILTITDPNHDYYGATGGWKVQSDQTVEWQDLTTLGAGYAYLGLGVTAAGKAMPDMYVYNAEAKYVAAYVTDDTGAISGFESIFLGESALMQVGIADFNADGVSDLLLRTADGFVGYFANNTFAEVQGLGTEWTVAAIGDIDGNGRADVIIAHEQGYVGAYLIGNDGSISWADLATVDETTAIVGTGDVNGDGTDDVIVQVGSNYYGAWLCGQGAVTGFFGIGEFDAAVQDIADYNGDGTDDLLLRTASGVVGAALISGADTTTWAEYGALGAEWSTKGVGIL